MMPVLIISLLVVLTAVAFASRAVRRRHLLVWLPAYLLQQTSRVFRRRRRGEIHVLLCIADHFEPTPGEQGAEAVEEWVREYPRLFGDFRDSDGRAPRHTFFYAVDMYDEQHVDAIAGLCARGFGEVEVHLHHDNDTEESLQRTLEHWAGVLSLRHGVLGRWPDGRAAYGFVHGNWALNNSRPDGRWCGVNDEISVLVRTGCYADFTLPSAPSPTQTRTINSLYYATGHPHSCKHHDRGTPVGSAPKPDGSLMLIQGPLALCRSGIRPCIENACIQGSQPPTMERLDRWIAAGIGVAGRPEVVFVKLHTHGATAANRRVLLGDAMVRFHAGLAERAASDPGFKYHYVTAREMYNIAKALEAGSPGLVGELLDFAVLPPGPNNSPTSCGISSSFATVPTGGRR